MKLSVPLAMPFARHLHRSSGRRSPIVGHEAARELQLSGSFLLRILVAMSRADSSAPSRGPTAATDQRDRRRHFPPRRHRGRGRAVRGGSDPVSAKDGGRLDRKLAEICDRAADAVPPAARRRQPRLPRRERQRQTQGQGQEPNGLSRAENMGSRSPASVRSRQPGPKLV